MSILCRNESGPSRSSSPSAVTCAVTTISALPKVEAGARFPRTCIVSAPEEKIAPKQRLKDRAKAKAEGGQFSATEKIDRRADENDRRDHPPTRRAPEAFARREAGSKCKRGIEQRLAGRDASS